MHIVNDGSQALAKPEKVYEAEIVEEPARIVVVAMNAASEGESVAEPAVETVEEAVDSAKIIIEEPVKDTAPKKTKASSAAAVDHTTKQVVSFLAAAVLMISLIALGSPALPF